MQDKNQRPVDFKGIQQKVNEINTQKREIESSGKEPEKGKDVPIKVTPEPGRY